MAKITVCRVDEVPSGAAFCTRMANGLRVAVARLGENGFVAFENLCPHAQGPVGNGQVRGDTIVCPWHFFRFDLKTGKPVGMDSVLQLKLFPVAVNNGEISIDI